MILPSPARRGGKSHCYAHTAHGVHRRNASLVEEALSLIGCQINVIKSEMLPMVKPPPACPHLAQVPPPCLRRAGLDFNMVHQRRRCSALG